MYNLINSAKDSASLDEQYYVFTQLRYSLNQDDTESQKSLGLLLNGKNTQQIQLTTTSLKTIRQKLSDSNLLVWAELPPQEFYDKITSIEELVTITGPEISENIIRQEFSLAPRCLYQESNKQITCTQKQIIPLVKCNMQNNCEDIGHHLAQCVQTFYQVDIINAPENEKLNQQSFTTTNFSQAKKVDLLNKADKHARKDNLFIAKGYFNQVIPGDYTNVSKDQLIQLIAVELNNLSQIK